MDDTTTTYLEDATRLAAEVEATLRLIRRLAQRRIEEDIAVGRVTAPQVSVLTALARQDGLSLKELSQRLSLSHSTVSGIVDRLAQRGLVERRPNPTDRRFTRIFLTEPVNAYLRTEVTSRRLGPLIEALGRASPEERAQVVAGLDTLRRLLEAGLAAGAALNGDEDLPLPG